MRDRFAFTAKYWGDTAVVCRSTEDRPGPIVEQEFGEFRTWTQANAFATRLNAGLEIDPGQAGKILISSILRANELLYAANSPESVGLQRGPVGGRSLRLQFMLTELDLAMTFCRIVRSKPSEHTDRLLRNARNALFDAMHFVCHADLAACELEAITERLEKLQAAFEDIVFQNPEELIQAAG
jgi:hypothetical protein